MFAIGSSHAARCADGTTRQAVIVNVPDTFFAVPARVRVRGKTVTGFVYLHGLGDDKQLRFTANQWGKNASLLPKWAE